ncbi:MAG: alpha/beta hydrolase [Actinomycetota bacterium]|nr:alpha/beta hydrolase [Actinomycetota bacterium]
MPYELHTIVSGPPAGDSNTVVVWIHGVDSDASVWDPAIELVSASHRCVAVDLLGHGASPVSNDEGDYRREPVLADIDAVLDGVRAESPGAPIVWVGHSLGGYLGLAHALTRAEGTADALVLVSTGPGFRDPDAMNSWNERVRANAPEYTVSEAAATIAFHRDSLVMERLTDLTLPVALVIGDGDRAFLGANDYLERKLPHAHRTTVENARHFVMRSHPDSVADAVATVIAELGADS